MTTTMAHAALAATDREPLPLITKTEDQADFIRSMARGAPWLTKDAVVQLLWRHMPRGVRVILPNFGDYNDETVELVLAPKKAFRRWAGEQQVLMDLSYMLPVWLGLTFGGCIKSLANSGTDKPDARPYLRVGPSNTTIAGLVMDARHGWLAAPINVSHPLDCRRSNLKLVTNWRHRDPRTTFILDAVRLFGEHAPASIGVSSEEYADAIQHRFERADSRLAQKEAA